MKTSILIATIAAGGILFGGHTAKAHCDAADGPVATAVQRALENGNINPVLAYAPETAEAEILAAFGQTRGVRTLGADARALADRAFMETVIRLHRAGEGAAYTGLKPAGGNYGPVIPAAEYALATGDLGKLKTVFEELIDDALRERFAQVQALQSANREPQSRAEVREARERISAELGFITFAESLHQAALATRLEHHLD